MIGPLSPIVLLGSTDATTMATVREMHERIVELEAALAVAQRVCGRQNCNCPGAAKVKAAIKAVMEVQA